jgi:hypothetical protein
MSATAPSRSTSADALRAIPSVPESEISETLAARLPEPVPAPWTTSGSGLLWLHRASVSATAHHQSGLSFDRALPVTVAAFLRYDEGPVGAYDEILAMPTLTLHKRRLSLPVAFIAVDSEASIAGGRANWALPKTLASFAWRERDGLARHIEAHGEGWSAGARLLWSGPRVPLWTRSRQTQVRADGSLITVPLRSRGIGRLARIEVQSDGPTLPCWLLGGVHFGLALERVTHQILPAVEDRRSAQQFSS